LKAKDREIRVRTNHN